MSLKTLVLFFLSLTLSFVAHAQTHKGIAFQGVIKLPSGEFPTRSGMTVNARILSPNDCILREEQFTSINLADGYIHLAVGTGSVAGHDPGFSMKQVMDNSAIINGLVCLNTDGTVKAGVTSFNPTITSGARKLRISLTIDSIPVVADFNMRAMAFAVNAESLNGKNESAFINTSANITQSAVEAWFAGAVLGQLTAGTYNASTATSAVTAQGLAASYVVPLTQGGTGATSATAARTNLGLGSLAIMSPTGTASASTYLRGDGSWATVTSGVSSVAGKTGAVTLQASDIADFNTATDARITAQKAANNGLATLNASGKVPSSQLALTTSDIPGLSASHITAGTFADSMLAGLSIDKLLNGTGKYFNYKPNNAPCSDDQVLKYDSTLNSAQGGWKCAADDSGLGTETDPTVQAYAKNAPSTGLKVTANQLAVDFGTGAGKVVEGDDSRLTGAFASSTSLSGDLSGTLPSPVVEKIKSQSISAAGSLAGQVLRYAGGNTWTPNFISMSDLRSSITGSAALTGTGCTAGQTLTWSSATDTLSCVAISITKSQISDFPTLAASATTDATNATNITSGTLDAARLPSSVSSGLWAASSGNVSRATGFVGIGTATPNSQLDVAGAIYTDTLCDRSGANCKTINTGWSSTGAATSMVPGWPDAIRCSYTAAGTVFLYPYSFDSTGMTYQANYGSAYYLITYAADGSYTSNTRLLNGGTHNCVGKSLAQATAAGYTFLYAGGGGNIWTLSGTSAGYVGGSVGIGTTSPSTSAILEVNATDKGFLPPRMTTTQRNAIATPTAGLIIFNSDTGRLNIYANSAWNDLFTDSEYSFSVNRGGVDQAITQSVDTLVDWTTAQFDTAGAVNLTTNRFQPTKAGKYLLTATAGCSGMDANSWCLLYIRKNGALIAAQSAYAALANSTMPQTASTLVNMNGTTDYVEIWVNTNDTSPVLSGQVGQLSFSGFLINGAYAPGGGGGAADNLGDHVVTQNLNLGSNWISGNGSSTGLRVDNSGNVGVKTATPTNPLTVSGDGGAGGGPAVIGINASNAGAFPWATNSLNPNMATNASFLHVIGKGNADNDSGYFGYHYNGAGLGTNYLTFGLYNKNDLMVINGNGNVGIGTAAPSAHVSTRKAFVVSDTVNNAVIEVWGTLGAKGLLQSVNGNTYVGNVGKGTGVGSLFLTAGAGAEAISVLGSSLNVGVATLNPTQKFQVGSSGDGSVAVANAWNTFSDKRLKNVISRIPNACEMVDQMNGYYYTWKEGKDQSRQVGVIAQEVEAVLPELVKTGSDGIKTVDYPKLTAVLIEANKELNQRTQDQEQEIKDLKAEVEQTKNETAALKAWLCSQEPKPSFCH